MRVWRQNENGGNPGLAIFHAPCCRTPTAWSLPMVKRLRSARAMHGRPVASELGRATPGHGGAFLLHHLRQHNHFPMPHLTTCDFRPRTSTPPFLKMSFATGGIDFLRRNDVLIVYHHRTYQLLQNIEACSRDAWSSNRYLGNRRAGFHSLEELMAVEEVTLPISNHKSRANQRLDMAVALVEHLRSRYGNQQ